ncbi:hypothetical protein San01_43360 [Streptomyces angustmyceticus]|uniref:Uncharacterized protein n=1 Tax=Streptomyces angustmyceticus TaxID=285578 RepID=A0A5J4LJX2_9ACTN|nr:hypothetical protein San01_43360 [Streptomyces angustmyceticus]
MTHPCTPSLSPRPRGPRAADETLRPLSACRRRIYPCTSAHTHASEYIRDAHDETNEEAVTPSPFLPPNGWRRPHDHALSARKGRVIGYKAADRLTRKSCHRGDARFPAAPDPCAGPGPADVGAARALV